MNKAYKTILAVLVMVFGFGFLATGAALADPIDPAAGELIVNFEDTPLFGNEEGNFMPGDNVIRQVEVINNTGSASDKKRIATEAINYPKTSITGDVPGGDLSQALIIIIREKYGDDIYGGNSGTGEKTLAEFYENGETYLSDVSGDGGTATYEFEVSFPESEGDEWQGATTGFDIIVGFQGEDDTGVTPPPSSGGGGLPPGLTISSEPNVAVDLRGITITWTTSYFSTSQVIYAKKGESGESDESHTLDLYAPNFGYARAYPSPENFDKVTGHSVTIPNSLLLPSGATYYFRVVSHASPPTISREYTFTTLALADGDGDTEQPTPDPSQEGNNQEGDDDDTGGGIPETYQRWVAGASDFIGDALDSFSGEDEDKKDEGEDKKDEDEKDGKVRGAGDEEDNEFYGIEEDTTEGGKESIFSRYWQWPFVLALLLMIFFFWYRRKKKKEEEIGN